MNNIAYIVGYEYQINDETHFIPMHVNKNLEDAKISAEDLNGSNSYEKVFRGKNGKYVWKAYPLY